MIGFMNLNTILLSAVLAVCAGMGYGAAVDVQAINWSAVADNAHYMMHVFRRTSAAIKTGKDARTLSAFEQMPGAAEILKLVVQGKKKELDEHMIRSLGLPQELISSSYLRDAQEKQDQEAARKKRQLKNVLRSHQVQSIGLGPYKDSQRMLKIKCLNGESLQLQLMNNEQDVHDQSQQSQVRDTEHDVRFDDLVAQELKKEPKNATMLNALFAKAAALKRTASIERLFQALPGSRIQAVEELVKHELAYNAADHWLVVPIVYQTVSCVYSALPLEQGLKAGMVSFNELRHSNALKDRLRGASILRRGVGHTLISCAQHGDVRSLQSLLQAHSELSASYVKGYTALHAAAEYGQEQAAKLLIAAGADVDACTDDGRTVMQIAKTDAIKALLVQAQQAKIKQAEQHKETIALKEQQALQIVAELELELLLEKTKARVQRQHNRSEREHDGSEPVDLAPPAAAAAVAVATRPDNGQRVQQALPVVQAGDWQQIERDPRFPQRGKCIDEIWYTRHALIRMAASTPAVTRYLENLALRMGLQRGSAEFAHYTQTRDVSSADIKRLLETVNPLERNDGRFIYVGRGLKVVVGADGAVITVIRTA
jgi:hypothetical protein